EKVRKGYDPYLFRFKSPIEITSEPKGATIYINQLLYPQKTPTTVEWEAGIPFSLEMEQENFQRLSGFNLNTLDGSEEIEDRRVWSFKTIDGEPKRYVVEGIFKKFIYVSCIPSGAIFYIDGSPTPSGRTDVSSTIALTMGKHEIIFQKAGFNSRTITVTVDKNGPESISVMLTRNVRFFAKDINDLGNNEIGARIVRIIQNNKAYPRNDRTPCELSLPPVDLQVVLSKEGYKDATVTVTTRDKDVVVKMEPAIALVEVIVTDGLTGLPLKDAQISYRPLSGTQTSETYFGATDENGRCTNKVGPGEYSFRVKKFGYFEKYAILNTKSGNSKLEFKLIIQ
ncbi:MAG: PEGA domain-containing protein, partial [candidate division KSB1 bacterium]|nr:PEGA domain-containing protein [candidate division KSB1 bacterium]